MKTKVNISLLAFALSGVLHVGSAHGRTLPAQCGDLASQESYASPDARNWLDALTRAFATLPNERDELAVFNAPKYSGVKGRPTIETAREKEVPRQEGLDRNARGTMHVPIKGDRFGGGSIAFGGDVYPNENFKWRFSVELPEDRSTELLMAWWAPITLDQAWLEWRAGENDFVRHDSSAQVRLLCRLLQQAPTVKLYRGTFMQEGALLDALKAAMHASPANAGILQDKLKELVSAANLVVEFQREREGAGGSTTREAQMTVDRLSALSADFAAGRVTSAQLVKPLMKLLDEQMRATQYGAFFASLEGERARGFAKGALVKLEFPVERLLALGTQHLLYAGIENDIEIAFLPGIDLKEFVEGFQGYEKVEQPKR